jgi:hypothetical protein
MPFTAPVLNIGQGLADGILSGANALSSSIDYVRDQYKNQKAAQGAMTALSNMKDADGNPMISPQMLDVFNKMSPQGQVAAAGMLSQKAQNTWDAQNKIAIAQAGAQSEGSQQRQTNAAQFTNYRDAWKSGNPGSPDMGKANSGIVGGNNDTTATSSSTAAQQPQPDVYRQLPLSPDNGAKSGFYSFRIDPKTGNPIPGTSSYVGPSAVPNIPLYQRPTNGK